MIFDAHVHLGLHEPFGPYEASEWQFETNMFGPEEFIPMMDAHGIQKAVMMLTKQAGDNMKENDEIARWSQKYPDRLIGCAILYPGIPNVADELERLVKNGIRYLKLHSYAQNYLPYLPFSHPFK